MTGQLNAGPDEDVNHPIPRLDTLDTVVETDRGAYVGIVIAAPLSDDSVSRARLQRKIEVSLGYFHDVAFREKHGPPSPAHCRIYLSVHSHSSASILELIEHFCSQFEANGVASVLQLIEPDA